ncbi:MAG: hypothetical protein R6W87_10445, partial [Halospina sp.]
MYIFLLAPVCHLQVALKGAGIAGFLMAEQRMNKVGLLQLFKCFNAFAVYQRNTCLAPSAFELVAHIADRLNNEASMAQAKVR